MVPKELSLHCPHCGRHTAVSPAPLAIIVGMEHMPNGIGDQSIRKWLPMDPFYRWGGASWWMGKCNACEKPLLVKDRGAVVYPTPQPGPVSADVPEPMNADLREAKQCLAAGAWNATVVMARRALQCAAVERGAPEDKRLWQQIAWLDEKRVITDKQRKWAEAVRWIGNHGAHETDAGTSQGGPFITAVTEADAREIVDLVEHLFETVYVANRKAEAQLAKRGKLKE